MYYYNFNSILNALEIIIIVTYYCCPCVLVSIWVHDCQDVNVHVVQHLCDFSVLVVKFYSLAKKLSIRFPIIALICSNNYWS